VTEQSSSPAGHTAARLRGAGCVFAEDEAAALAERFSDPADLGAAVDRRCEGMPLELVLGQANFAGVTVTVQPGVFLPRRRAAALVEVADEVGRTLLPSVTASAQRPVTALDLGCGTGAIAAALRDRQPTWAVHASDIDPAAVWCAQVNAERFGFAVHQSDWLDGLPASLRKRLDLIVAHLPYVPTNELTLLPRDYRAAEPTATVDGGADGLAPWRAVARQCVRWLAPHGCVLTQVTADQEAAAAAIAVDAGLRPETVRYDDSVVVAASARD
jgi:release factor glutamine methyltransferase